MPRYLSNINLRKLSGKICLLRIDLNIEDTDLRGYKNRLMRMTHPRIEAIIPTIKLLLKNEIRVVLLSHRGRPALKPESKLKGLKSDWDFTKGNRRLSLKPFAKIIAAKIKSPVYFIPYEHSWLLDPKEFVAQQKEKIFLFENLRFYRGEEINDWRFAKFLSDWGDFYVNDAFAVSHRQNASVVAITKFLPSYAGLSMEKEIKNLDKVIKNHRHPFAIIIGGAKISDKIGVIKYFWNKAKPRSELCSTTGADYFLIGGGPANTFFAAQGLPVGDSLIDQKAKIKIKNYLNSKKIVVPSDVKISGRKILDIGPKTIEEFSKIIKKSKTIIWNGPMGLFEKKGFGKGTIDIWEAILKNKKANTVVGGGETLTSLRLLDSRFYFLDSNIFLSTGGGAMLEYLSGKKLPGIEVLKR